MNFRNARAAFTLLETILYLAIVSVLSTVLILFAIDLLETRGENEFDREVSENARFVMDLMTRQIRDAEDVTSITEAHPASLTLDGDSATLTFDTATKTVGGQTIRYLQFNDGSGAQQITSDLVNVTNFALTDLTRGSEPDNIQIEFTLEALDGSENYSVRSSVSLRE